MTSTCKTFAVDLQGKSIDHSKNYEIDFQFSLSGTEPNKTIVKNLGRNIGRNFVVKLEGNEIISIYYLLTGCKGRTTKYKPKVFHTARACEGCLENQGLVFPGTARAPS